MLCSTCESGEKAWRGRSKRHRRDGKSKEHTTDALSRPNLSVVDSVEPIPHAAPAALFLASISTPFGALR